MKATPSELRLENPMSWWIFWSKNMTRVWSRFKLQIAHSAFSLMTICSPSGTRSWSSHHAIMIPHALLSACGTPHLSVIWWPCGMISHRSEGSSRRHAWQGFPNGRHASKKRSRVQLTTHSVVDSHHIEPSTTSWCISFWRWCISGAIHVQISEN